MSDVKEIAQMSYEDRMDELNELLSRLDRSETPIDQLAADTRRGVALILSMKADLKNVELEVRDAFADLDAPPDDQAMK
jgi:exodeoxyribonuclease VII small subunit